MLIIILIIAGILLISETIDIFKEHKSNIFLMGALNVLLWWPVSLPVAICVIAYTLIILLVYALIK